MLGMAEAAEWIGLENPRVGVTSPTTTLEGPAHRAVWLAYTGLPWPGFSS